MVKTPKFSLLIATTLLIQGCKQSSDSETAEVPDALTAIGPAGERAAPAGLTRFAPRETEFLFLGRGFAKVGESLLKELDEESESWNNGLLLVQESDESDLPEFSREDIKSTTNDLIQNPISAALGNEFLFCGWNGTDKVMNHLSGIWNALGRLRVTTIATGYAGIFKGEDFVMEELEPILDEALTSLKWNRETKVPSLLFAMETESPSDGNAIKRDFLKTLRQSLETNGFTYREATRTVRGSVFEGYSSEFSLPGEDQATLSFVVLTGQLEDGIFFYFGDQAESLTLPPGKEQSIHPLASSLLWNQYAGKKILALSFVDRELVKSLHSFSDSNSPWSVASEVFEKAGLRFEQQEEITTKLTTLEDLELAASKPVFHDQASVIFLDKGINLEEVGGAYFPHESSQSDWHILDESPPSTFRLHYRVDEKERTRNLLYLEETLSLIYLLFREMVDPLGVEEKSPSFAKASKSRDLNQKLGNIYRSWKDNVLTGLGSEYLIVGDLNGAPPAGESYPLPRAVLVAPVGNWRALALGLSQISRDTKDLHRSLAPIFGMNEEWPLTERVNREDWYHYRESNPTGTDGWQPAVGWNRKFFFAGSNEKFGQQTIQNLSIRDESVGDGFLLEVNLGEILDLIWEWDKSARPIESDSLRFSELNFIRERISRLKYRARSEDGKNRISLNLGFRTNN